MTTQKDTAHAHSSEPTAAHLYQRASAAARAAGDSAPRIVDVIASTEALDSHGTTIRGPWKLDRFRANPVVLWAHRAGEIPVGKATHIEEREGRLEATIELVSDDVNPRAGEIWRSLQAGTLKGVSVGFAPGCCEVQGEGEGEHVILVLGEPELFEISFASIPSNPETLATLRQRAVGAATPTPAPRRATLGDLLREGLGLAEQTTHDGRRYEELAPMAKHELLCADPAKYRRLRRDWEQRGQPDARVLTLTDAVLEAARVAGIDVPPRRLEVVR